MNALLQDWAPENGYANPPFGLLLRVLLWAMRCRACLTLVVPVWPSRVWWPLLELLAVDAVAIPTTTLTFLQKGHLPRDAPRWRVLAVRVDGSRSDLLSRRDLRAQMPVLRPVPS